MQVEIWSDVACPWCHVGKRRFEQALARFPHRDAVDVVWRSFQLDPGAVSAAAGEPVRPGDYAERLAAKYATSTTTARQMVDSMTAVAAAEGLDFRFDRAVRANTFDAHQVIHLAHARGAQDAVKERLLRAYFTEGEALGDRSTLVRLAADAGLPADEVAEALALQRFAADVRRDEAAARSLGITGVPFFVVDRTYGVSGAQPADVLLEVLDRAWSDSRALTVVGAAGGSGDACGPDGCPV